MGDGITVIRNALVRMRDGVALAADVVRPAEGPAGPAILNFGPYHKDGRGGRLNVETVHRHFAARGYAAVTADLRGLGNSGGTSPGPFAPGEALDGHDLVEWIAAQPWCDGNVGMWGVSYPGITALATAATEPPHLKAIVPIHATSDLHRGVVALGGTGSGFWMRADWGPRMVAYNLMPPLLQDPGGRWAEVWAEHLEGNAPWVEAFVRHPGFDPYWRARAAAMDRVPCPTFSICGWRDLYADCTPRDFAAIGAPKKLLMGPWKHEFPDTAREAPAAGLHDMERWFDRWLIGTRNGIEDEPPVSLYVQGREGHWRAEAAWPPAGLAPHELFLASDGTLAVAGEGQAGASEHVYDPTIGMQSLAWDPWTTAVDPFLPHDQAADDARSLCFTGARLTAPLELVGPAAATLEVAASELPLNLVVKLAAVQPNGRSVLIACGWTALADLARPGERVRVTVPLRATAYRLMPGEQLRVAISCADFPRVWPTPFPATLRLFHGASRIRLPVCPAPAGAAPPSWGPLQPALLGSPNDRGGGQVWNLGRDLMTDTVQLSARKAERLRVDASTELAIDHAYGAAVGSARPDLARMDSATTVRIERPTGATTLVARSVTTTHHTAVEVDIAVDGRPFWARRWHYGAGFAPPG